MRLIVLVLVTAAIQTDIFAVSPKSQTGRQKRPAIPSQILTGSEPEISTPLPRYLGPSSYAAATQSILIATGARELDYNNSWNRMIQRDPTGVVHMAYGIFKNIPGQNNTYRYNVYNAPGFPNVMKYADGTEPASGATSMQNGGLSFQPGTNAGIMYGRGPVTNASNSGCIVSWDSGQALGLFSLDSIAGNGATGNPLFFPRDPSMVAASTLVWITAMPDIGHIGQAEPVTIPDIWVSRTTDAGETWSIPVYRSNGGFFAECDIVANASGSLIYIVSPADPADTGAYFTTERPCYIKSTDGGATWSAMTDITGSFELPDYVPINISIDAIMVEDTLHVFWLDWDKGSGLHPGGPGGHVHHVAVFPDGSINGPQKVTDINIDGGEPDRSTTALGAGNALWLHISSSYRPSPLPTLYVLWSAPPDNGSGGYSDSTDPALTPAQYFGCFDIFMASSRNHGRSWDTPRNITQTNAPGCNGTTIPCYSEDMFQVAEVADTLLYVLTKVDKFPGFQAVFTSGNDSGPDTRLSDELRLLLVPSRTDPCDFCCSAAKGDLNNDGFLNSTDVVLELNCVFLSDVPPLGCNCDLNCDNQATPADVVLELNAVFVGTPVPPCP